MRTYHRALFVVVLAALVIGSMSVPRLEADTPTTAAQGAGKARRARKRLARAIRKKGLASLPPVSNALASHDGGGGKGMAAEVVGTPPTLVELGADDPTAVFWQAGVVAAIAAGTPTQQQCSEFWGGQTDGTSAGMGACHMAQDLAQSFGHVLQAENSLCYMRNVPTQANLASGGLQVVSGELPAGGIRHLFAVQDDAERLVEVQVTGEEEDQRVMLRVASATANAAAGNLYAVDLYFCPMTPGAAPRGYERLTLGTDGHFLASQGNNDDGGGGSGTNLVDGWMVGSGPGARWDTTRPRSLDIRYGGSQGTFKSSVQLSGDVISNRAWSNWGGGDWRTFTVTRFSGTGPTEVRFVSGAFEGSNGPQPSIGTAEYRGPIYVAAPGLDLVSQVSAVDMNTDPFFATPPSIPTIDTSGYSCDVTGDVVLAMDFTNPTIAAIKAECEGPRLDNVRLCEDNPTIFAAMQNSPSVCNFSQP